MRDRRPRISLRSVRATAPRRNTLPRAVLTVGVGARLPLLLCRVSLVPPDEAAGGGAQQAMMAGVMAGDSADQRALDASLGVGHRMHPLAWDTDGARSMTVAKANAVPSFFMGTPVVSAKTKMSRLGSRGSTGGIDQLPASRVARRSTGTIANSRDLPNRRTFMVTV
jgi:hypothetical protein